MNCCFYLFKRVLSYKNNVNTMVYNLLLANLSVNGMPAIDDFFLFLSIVLNLACLLNVLGQ